MANTFTLTEIEGGGDSNLLTFGVNATKLNLLINPAKSPHSYSVGAMYTGVGTGNATGELVDLDAAFNPDQWNDFFLVGSDGARHLITDTTSTTITTDDDVSAVTSYSVIAQNAIPEADATAIATRVVGEIKSKLPEKYRVLLSEVQGELIVEQAFYKQATAHTTFVVSPTSSLHLWRNPDFPWANRRVNSALYSPLDKSQGVISTADYAIGSGDPTVITFQIGGNQNVNGYLERGDTVIAWYRHELSTVPRVLESIALSLTAYEILWQSGLGVDQIPENVTEHKAKAEAMLAAIAEGKAGIHELDQIRLYASNETRSERAGGYSSVPVWRG